MKQRKIMFLALSAFSSMGGIEKFNRAFIKAVAQLQTIMHIKASFAGLYDRQGNEDYVPASNFRAYFGKRMQFVVQSFIQSFSTDHLILGHINLAIVGVLFKTFQPGKKLTVICHGIEVFEPVTGIKKKLLQKADHFITVSEFTKSKLIQLQQVSQERIDIFPNTIDPFFQLPADFSKPAYLKERYKIKPEEKIVFTLTRLNSNEGYKGHDKVIIAISQLVKKGVKCKYILAGKADAVEQKRTNELIAQYQLEGVVIMTGFIADEEVTDHYLLADVFIMPSKGEGFGIVFLEAMACGLPVIAGNKDGSTDAVKNGELGILVDPDNTNELQQALLHVLKDEHLIKDEQLQQKVMQAFGFNHYTARLQQILEHQLAA
jgi:phosphatidyl-myo-inositol dimannoside synthase